MSRRLERDQRRWTLRVLEPDGTIRYQSRHLDSRDAWSTAGQMHFSLHDPVTVVVFERLWQPSTKLQAAFDRWAHEQKMAALDDGLKHPPHWED